MVAHLSVALGVYLYGLNNIDPTTIVLIICKLRLYILQSTSMMYRWCLTAACFDRYALSAVNTSLRNIAQLYIARRIIASIVLIWIVLPVHTLIFYNLKGNICGIVYHVVAAYYHSIFTTVTGGILPVVIMIVCALLIHHNLVLKQQRRRQLNNVSLESTSQSRRNNSQTKRDQQVLFMLLVQVSIYAILMTPLMSWYFYSAITLTVTNKSADRVAIERFAIFMAELIIFAFPTSSFYLYTMSSQIFRAELMIMIRCALHCKWSNTMSRIEPTAATGDEIKTVSGHLATLRTTSHCGIIIEKLTNS